MLKTDEKSNAQCWELEVTCKNRQYLNKVVKAILKYGHIEFEVNTVELYQDHEGVFNGNYLVFIWCSWFHNLSDIANDLKEIERKFEDFK
jgi:hypothetical protein